MTPIYPIAPPPSSSSTILLETTGCMHAPESVGYIPSPARFHVSCGAFWPGTSICLIVGSYFFDMNNVRPHSWEKGMYQDSTDGQWSRFSWTQFFGQIHPSYHIQSSSRDSSLDPHCVCRPRVTLASCLVHWSGGRRSFWF
jgi:hypothetical protein